MTEILVGASFMAALALALRARVDAGASELARAVHCLSAFCGLLALLGLGDLTNLRGGEMAALVPLPLLLARHIEALTASRSSATDLVLSGAGVLLLLPFATLPEAARHAIDLGDVPALSAPGVLLLVVGVGLFWLLLIGVTAAALWRIWRGLARHRARLAQIVAAPPGLRLEGVWLLFGFLGLALGTHLADLVIAATGRSLLSDAMLDAFALILVLGVALHGLTLHAALPDWADEIAAPADGPAYARSGLDDVAQARLLERLDSAMAGGRLWREPMLTLRDLARAAEAKPFYVSQALNQGRGVTFFDYVNGWRIAEAQDLLRSGDQSVIGIAYDVGFNAKSTFNAAFRTATGMTPTDWRRCGPAGPDASPTAI